MNVDPKNNYNGEGTGCFFQTVSQAKTLDLGIKGSVENLPDGDTVLIVATGLEARLAELISWCQKGPSRAEVKNVEISDLPLQEFENFSIL
ncbi:acylphosphatase [Niabella hibiscisoli]|uniref:acylphosphatase n=1 Tax=Niabella hibiscisoli TaxID=1825928 RepID=UPI001F0D168A|nr:acylphosphatase [Niabella hibiscisoli]MCH5718078.1 acylphosphatase [Niabella hibiscisoli]